MTAITLPLNNTSYANQIVQLGNGPSKFAKSLQSNLGFLPKGPRKYTLDLLLTGSFVSALFLSLRAALMELLPKAGVGGLVRAKSTDGQPEERPTLLGILQKILAGKASFNWPVALDEAFLEIPEYFVMYFLPTLASTGLFAKLYGGMVGVDFEALGRPLHEYKANLGKTVQFGAIENKTLHVTKETISKIALGKSALFASVVAFCGAMEYIVPSFRVFLTKWFLGIDDFSKLLGFNESLSQDQGLDPMKKAANNVRNGLILTALTVPPIVGLTWAMSKRLHNPKVSGFANKFSTHLDLEESFGLSNTPLAMILLPYAIPGYLSSVRGTDEKIEVINRVILYSIPTIILYKQAVLTFFSSLAALAFGAGKGWMSFIPKTVEEIKAGRRDPLNFNVLSGFGKDKQTGEYHGMVTELPGVKALKPEKRQAFFKTLGYINKLPLILAPAIGVVINLFNLQQIFDMHQKDSEKRSKSPVPQPA